MSVRSVLAICFTVAVLGAQTARGAIFNDEHVAITSLDLTHVEQGWGKPSVDKTVDGHPLSIAGRSFAHGLGTHSPGVFLIDLNGGSRRFTAWAGIDDETAKRGSAEFQVLGDGKILWSSGIMRGGDPAKRVDIDLTAIKQLALLVGDAGDGFEYDHADWAEAEILYAGSKPKSAAAAASNPIVSAPRVPDRPLITSPATVGVFPGTPLLYTISCIGALPISFSATGLPNGLKLDPGTGRITGTAERPGDYRVVVKARNARGSGTKTVQIKVGGMLALTPPLGWNSYDCFGDDVTEAEVLANATYMNDRLKAYGWSYVVVDYRWYDPDASKAPNDANVHQGKGLSMDGYGRLLPAANRFPSAAGGAGFKALADQVHAMGLRFGIHVMRGITRQAVLDNTPIEGSSFHAADAANLSSTCPWCSDMYGVDASKPAGQAWYDSLLRLYASWGVDYIKVDDMSAPYSTLEIAAVHRAIQKCGRSIVLSLSPGDTPVEQSMHVSENANLWRISGDFWDNWGAVNHQFDLLARWKGVGGPGHWPDADMIPLGHVSVHGRSVGPDRRTALTHDEQLTMMSLWALAPSPMMLGMHLPDNDDWTLSLITNEEVMAVNQDPAGKPAVKIPGSGNASAVEIWKREMEDGSMVVGVFNRIGIAAPASITWDSIGIKKGTAYSVRDLWQRREDSVIDDKIDMTVGPHGAVLLQIRPALSGGGVRIQKASDK